MLPVNLPGLRPCSTCRWQKPERQFYSASSGVCRSCHVRKSNAVKYARPLEDLMWYAARQRAKKAGVPFSITPGDISIPPTCPILGIALRRGKGKPGPASPSLDRIIPRLGYVPGNVIVISNRANTLKNNATASELRALADFYAPFEETS